jgi:hypothetical protein
VANESAPWTSGDRRRLAEERGAVGGQQGKRERIREALAEHPEASHNAIAKMIGVSHNTVEAVCREVVNLTTSPEGEQSNACRHGQAGQGARTGLRPKPPTETETRVGELLRENPQQSNKQIQATAGLSWR